MTSVCPFCLVIRGVIIIPPRRKNLVIKEFPPRVNVRNKKSTNEYAFVTSKWILFLVSVYIQLISLNSRRN